MSEIDPLQLVHAGQKRFSNEGMVEKEKQQRKHKGKAKLMSGSTNSQKKNRKWDQVLRKGTRLLPK